MQHKIIWKSVLVVAVILLFAYFLYPTLQFSYFMNRADQELLRIDDPEKYDRLLKNSIKLGLDLQGGMNLVMEVDVKALLNVLANNKDERFELALQRSEENALQTDESFLSLFAKNLEEIGVDVARYYGNRTLRDKKEILEYLQKETDEAIDRSLEVLRNRIDQFGVAEPTIQKQGDRRIIVELAGVTDPDRVRSIVGKTALLEFRLLKDPQITDNLGSRINNYLKGEAEEDTAAVSEIDNQDQQSPEDTAVVKAEELFGELDGEGDVETTEDSTELARKKVLEENLFFFDQSNSYVLIVPKENEARLYQALEDPAVQQIINQEIGDAELLVADTDPDQAFIPVYVANKDAELTGETIEDAQEDIGRGASSIGGFVVSLRFNDDGAKVFSRVTGANLQKPLAIVLDKKVHSAPIIQTKIRDGRAEITGLSTMDEAKDLAVVLKAGALPAPLKILEERTVGPSLGKDSVEKGAYSALMGLLFVALFMMVYYKVSGIIACFALILNLLIILGTMSVFHATLTLPGIAGLILTIGMAVDANVLIFERIREEVDKGKSVWAAVDTGYSRAIITILDANVTTLIAAIVLYNFGTGPVRGFATVLGIGILASMFTAIFVTRTIYEFLLSKKVMKQISI